uniref:NADH-ubiquinone oxidoreductase chain 2 n=1 Tax=Changeondelphax velitchkovskyi TaxID=1291384 RepID=A0A343UJA8_9HEMI|nr:NADH dehydrogenase subunit 2 [Changeondelphax velitchkovskyi]AVC55486.1 NADH dehydrogenase subunit 2 [Changeondelphax velitchkovskyi]
MKMNSSMTMFVYMIFMSTLISLSTNNWLSMWIMMEMALFMFIPLISKNKVNDQSMKYFIIQSISSYTLIFSIMWNSSYETNLNSLLSLISLMLKTGMAPFHLWKPMIMSKIKWKECMLLTTLIKIPPMIFFNKMIKFNMMILPLSLSLIVGATSGINQLNLKKMMAYSSIFNLTWMTSSFLISKKIMLTFFTLYSLLNIKLMIFFKKNNLMYLNQMNYLPLNLKLIINMNMLSISGLPPLTGFYPKWIILSEMINYSIILPSMMVTTSILSIYMYIQINSLCLSNSLVKKKNSKVISFKNFSLLNLLILPAMFMFWM